MEHQAFSKRSTIALKSLWIVFQFEAIFTVHYLGERLSSNQLTVLPPSPKSYDGSLLNSKTKKRSVAFRGRKLEGDVTF